MAEQKLEVAMAWMLVYLKTCIDYLQLELPDAYRQCGVDQLHGDLDALIRKAGRWIDPT
jgi:hypothetical protein